jgi:hypothetical protein
MNYYVVKVADVLQQFKLLDQVDMQDTGVINDGCLPRMLLHTLADLVAILTVMTLAE